MHKLIQFQNIIKEFDGQIVLKGINLDIFYKFLWLHELISQIIKNHLISFV